MLIPSFSLSGFCVHSLSHVLVVMMKSKELKTKINSHAHPLILSLAPVCCAALVEFVFCLTDHVLKSFYSQIGRVDSCTIFNDAYTSSTRVQPIRGKD